MLLCPSTFDVILAHSCTKGMRLFVLLQKGGVRRWVCKLIEPVKGTLVTVFLTGLMFFSRSTYAWRAIHITKSWLTGGGGSG